MIHIRDRIVIGIRSQETQKQPLATKKLTLAESNAKAETSTKLQEQLHRECRQFRNLQKFIVWTRNTPPQGNILPNTRPEGCIQSRPANYADKKTRWSIKSKCPKWKKMWKTEPCCLKMQENKKLYKIYEESNTPCSESDSDDISDIEASM